MAFKLKGLDRSVTHTCPNTVINARDVGDLLQLLDTKYKDSRIGFDVEANGLDPYLESFGLTGIGFAVQLPSKNRKMGKGVRLGKSWYIDTKCHNEQFSNADIALINDFLSRNSYRLWVFNCGYEFKVVHGMFGKMVECQDTQALVTACHEKGSLKNLCQKYINGKGWEDDSYEVESRFAQVFRLFKDKKTPKSQINKSLLEIYLEDANEDIGQLVSIINRDNPDGLKEYICNGLSVDQDLHESDVRIPLLLGLKSEYEILDEFSRKRWENRGRLSNVEDTSPVEAMPPSMVDMILSKFEHGCWETETVIREQGGTVEGLTPNSLLLHLLCRKISLDEFIQGFHYFTHESGWGAIPTSILAPYCGYDCYNTLELRDVIWTYDMFRTSYGYYQIQNILSAVLEYNGVGWDDAQSEYLSNNYLRIGGDSLYELIGMLEIPDDKYQNNKAILENLSKGCTLPLTFTQTHDARLARGKAGLDENGDIIWVAKESEVTVNDSTERINILKGIFNPNSNKKESYDLFWNKYLTPMQIAVNMFHGIKDSLIKSDCWKYLGGTLVEADDFEETGKKVAVPIEYTFVHPDQPTTVITRSEIVVDMEDLGLTISALQNISMEIGSLTSSTITRVGRGKGLDDLEIKEIIKAMFKGKNLKFAIDTALGNVHKYATLQTQRFASEFLNLQHSINQEFLGLDMDDPTTWSDEFRMVVLFRLFKKSVKSRSTYVEGNKLGRGAVYEIYDSKVVYGQNSGDPLSHNENVRIRSRKIREIDGNDYPAEPEKWGEKEKINADKGFILVTGFHSCSALTKRWRASLHTVPAESELRRQAVPRIKGGIWCHSDFAGNELACVSAIAGEMAMQKCFLDFEDIHINTASLVWRLPKKDISNVMRRYSKTFTFRLLYGGGVEGLAEALGVPIPEAQGMMEGFYQAYPDLYAYIVGYQKMAKDQGYVPTIFGSVINIPSEIQESRDREAINYPVQHAGSNIAGVTFYRMWKLCMNYKIPWIPMNFTHDSIDSETCPLAYFSYKALLGKISSVDNYKQFGTPTRMDHEVGFNQYDLCEFDVVSGVNSGMTESDPHIIHVSGWEHKVLGTLELFKNDYELELDLHEPVPKIIPNELFIPMRSFNDDFGNLSHTVKGTVRMIPKTGKKEYRIPPSEMLDGIVANEEDIQRRKQAIKDRS